jgi:hypothetical protein
MLHPKAGDFFPLTFARSAACIHHDADTHPCERLESCRGRLPSPKQSWTDFGQAGQPFGGHPLRGRML